MGEQMLPWHRTGQKVALVDNKTVWVGHDGGKLPKLPLPRPGEVCTITGIEVWHTGNAVALHLAEYPWWPVGIAARWFRPVYPAAIDSLRSLDAPINHHEVETV